MDGFDVDGIGTGGTERERPNETMERTEGWVTLTVEMASKALFWLVSVTLTVLLPSFSSVTLTASLRSAWTAPNDLSHARFCSCGLSLDDCKRTGSWMGGAF